MKRIFIVCICSLFVFSGCGKEDIPAQSDSEDVSTMSDSVQITEEPPQEDTAVKTFTDAEIEKALGNLQKGTSEFKPGYASYLSSLQSIPYEDSVYIRHGTVLHLYINTYPDGHASLCAGVEYSGKSWTFFDELLFLADDDVFTVKVNRNDKTEKPGSYVHEKYSWILSDDDVAMFNQLVTSKKRKLRFQGKDNHSVYEFNDEDIQAITDVLDAYKALVQE